jgi:hypothetical protein
MDTVGNMQAISLSERIEQLYKLAGHGARIAFVFVLALFAILVIQKSLHIEIPAYVVIILFSFVCASFLAVVLPAFVWAEKLEKALLAGVAQLPIPPLQPASYQSQHVETASPPPRKTPEN